MGIEGFIIFLEVPRNPLFRRALVSREQPETPQHAWLPLPLPLLLLSSLLLLFSSQLCLSLFILPLVPSHYWHFCQSTAQNAVSNSSNQQSPLCFLPPLLLCFCLFHFRQWLAWTDNIQLSSHPPPSIPWLRLHQHLLCPVRLWAEWWGGWGGGQTNLDADCNDFLCPVLPSTSSSLSWWSFQGASGKDVSTLNGSLFPTSCCPAGFPPSLPQWTRQRMTWAENEHSHTQIDIRFICWIYECMIGTSLFIESWLPHSEPYGQHWQHEV